VVAGGIPWLTHITTVVRGRQAQAWGLPATSGTMIA
jgi:hypothetical protein